VFTRTNEENVAKVNAAGIARSAAVLSLIATAGGVPASIKKNAVNEAKAIAAVTAASAVGAASSIVIIQSPRVAD
jgi:uncharacterized protein (UPF0147 family)